MGNYTKIEVEFIERTLELIEQYYAELEKYPYKKQFNYTLILNCMLGLIIMPKEIEIPIEDVNPVTEIRKKSNGSLVIERTHEKPVTKTETHNIAELRWCVNKIDGVIALWQSKRKVHQDLIDEYEGLP